jgi:dihydroorotate dehydrogenase
MIHIPFDFYPFLRPFLFALDPEDAHTLAFACLKRGLIPRPKMHDDPVLRSGLGGIEFPHPIGLAAGFDKQAEIIPQLFDLGFSFAEIGGVTPSPQPGNPRPRMFRIAESGALINRFNLNSVGFVAFAERLDAWRGKTMRGKDRQIVGVNIARGDNCRDDAEAYILGMKRIASYVHFVTLNVSCPNEPGARKLEGRDQLKELLGRVKAAHDTLAEKPLLFVKISPDQTEKQAQDIAEVALASRIDGMIVGNTTATRPASVTSPVAREKGGLSGRPLFEMSTKLLGTMYQLTQGKIPLIGCGGVFSGADAYAKIRAGASLVQIYTAMIFEGPYVVAKITDELAALLKRDGFACVKDAVGADFKRS